MIENNSQYADYSQNPQSTYPRAQIKSKFLTFIFALIPGAGQMYHGLVKKGVSIMALFFGVIAVGVLLYIPVINLALPIIWFYSFFDAINRINYTVDELKAMDDSYIVNLGLDNNSKIKNLLKGRHVLLGWIIIIIGIYVLLHTVIFNNSALINLVDYEVYNYISSCVDLLPKLIIPIICLFIGVKLIKSSIIKQENATEPNVTEEKINEE